MLLSEINYIAFNSYTFQLSEMLVMYTNNYVSYNVESQFFKPS